MLAHLKPGVAVAALSLSLGAQATEALDSCSGTQFSGCGIIFNTIPSMPSLTTSTVISPSSAYVIQNTNSNAVTLNSITLLKQSDDTVGAGAVTLDAATTCISGTVLSSDETCDIYLDFQPDSVGLLDWNLIVKPVSSQKPLALDLTATVTVGSGPFAIAAGSYVATNNNFYPLAVQSPNMGVSGSYGFEGGSPLPMNYDSTNSNQYGFYEANCFSTDCLAGGAYYLVGDTDNTGYPMIAYYNGISWAYSIDETNAPDDIGGQGIENFSGLSCFENQCIATLTYTDGTYTYPLIYGSTTSGASWSTVMDSSNAATYGASNLGQAACSSAGICTTVFSGGSNAGTILTTSNAGGTWNTTSDTSAGLYYVACGQNSDYCITADAAATTVVSSTNGGSTWSATSLSSGAGLPSDVLGESAYIAAISCSSGGTCIIAGDYTSSIDYNQYFWAAISTDLSTWTLVMDSSSAQPNNFDAALLFSYLLGATCTEMASTTTCLFTGFYSANNGSTYPFVGAIPGTAIDTTEVTYTLDSSSTLPTNFLATDAGGGQFEGVSCNPQWCIAMGYYRALDGHSYPLLASSVNAGSTWQYRIEMNLNEISDLGVTGQFNAGGN